MTVTSRTGGQILVDQLRLHGVDRIFGVPGESYLAVLDALHDHSERMPFVVCRQEGGAAMMADAYGKLTGRPGICMVTRGPGATNASAGVHIADQDSTPMILFVGQVGRRMIEREAFQEIDYRRMFGTMAKWVAQIDDPTRLPEHVSHAFHLATSGRPGPVVLALPEDMLDERATVADPGPYRSVQAYPAPEDMARLNNLLRASDRPLVLLGGGGWDQPACTQVERFAQRCGLPVAATFRRQDLFDNAHPCYVGDVGLGVNPRLFGRIRNADLLLVLGARLGEATTGGYTLLDIPRPRQTLVHVHAGMAELGRVYQADLPINAGPRAFAAALDGVAVDGAQWSAWREAARRDYEAWQVPAATPGPLQMGDVLRWLDDHLPEDAIVTNGAGNYTVWVHRFHRYRRFATQLAPTSGSMGYGVPAAVAAKIMYPERSVVCFAGDGCFLMHGQEFATAVHYSANAVFLVVNNGMYGTIRMHQERHYPGRVSATALSNPDFAAYARAFGGYGEVVVSTAEFPAAFDRASRSGAPAILELRIDPEALIPGQSLSEIRTAAQSRQSEKLQ